MLSATICEGYAPRYHTWDEPSAAEIARNDAEHERYIQAAKDHQREDQEAAKRPGTHQNQQFKAAIEAARAKQQAEGVKRRTPSIRQVFKKERYPQPPQRKKGTKGIDYIRYMNQFQVPIKMNDRSLMATEGANPAAPCLRKKGPRRRRASKD